MSERVSNLQESLRLTVYTWVCRGLFEKDKVTFKLQMCLKILIKAKMLTQNDVNILLKAGGGIDDRNKKFSWMD